MKIIQATLLAAIVGASSFAFADSPVTDTTRDQRMDSALQSYRNSNSANTNGRTSRMSRDTSGEGPAARAEDSMKRGLHRTGQAIKNGAEKTGHAIGNGARKTGAAIHRGADKVTGKSPDAAQ